MSEQGKAVATIGVILLMVVGAIFLFGGKSAPEKPERVVEWRWNWSGAPGSAGSQSSSNDDQLQRLRSLNEDSSRQQSRQK